MRGESRSMGILLCVWLTGCPNSTPTADAAPNADASTDTCALGSDGYALYFEDRDDDGAGNPDVSFATCTGEPPFPSWVRASGDCDDLDPERYAGNEEICNGLDEDCTGTPDDGLTFEDYFLDADGDTFGSGDARRGCAPPEDGWVLGGDDCDDADPLVHPGATERCNGYDDDCVGGADDGDVGALCAAEGGVCIFGRCGCEGAEPTDGVGESCAEAIDLGTLTEPIYLGTGPLMTRSVHVLPTSRSVWYRFRATELNSGAEGTGCDEFHVRARLAENPDDRYTLRVKRGACSAPYSEDEREEWVTDTSYTLPMDLALTRDGVVVGQCPCGAGSRPPCRDDAGVFFVEIRLRDPSSIICAPATLEVSNGYYDAESLEGFPDCPTCR